MPRKSKFSDAEILALLREAQAGTPVRQICEREGFTAKTFYRWRARFSSALAREAPHGSLFVETKLRSVVPPPTLIQQLEEENRRLKELVAELSLDNRALRAAAGRNNSAAE